jgi:alpha-glucosidase (family GH31 glycosyl hydrolase)
MQNEIDYYFVYGDDMDDVISGYRTLTGKSQIMPKWAMGYWQSREKYNTREEVLSTLKEFRERQIPFAFKSNGCGWSLLTFTTLKVRSFSIPGKSPVRSPITSVPSASL